MSEKVILILVDGMRPDGMMTCGHPFPQQLLDVSTYTLEAQTVNPSVTLPCIMSLFHSVDPDRHGVTTNTYMPQVRPIAGMFDQFDQQGKKCAFFYTWEELRDLSRPGHLYASNFVNLLKQKDTDRKVTDMAIDYIKEELPDFTFLYLGETDSGGHSYGWMGSEYMQCLRTAYDCIQKVYENLPEGYTMIVTADHGGHGRTHGSTDPQDMTTPVIIHGPRFAHGKVLESASIKDIATTVASLLEVSPAPEWEGKVLR